MQSNRAKGFTIIELAVTLVVASIVISFAVSGFQNTASRNQLSVQVNTFVGAMQFARSEAIKRGVSVTMRSGRYVDAGGNFVDSGGSWQWQSQWENGWEIFIDPEPDGIKNGNPPLRIGGQLPQTFTLRSNANISIWISYQANGRTRGNGGLGTGSIVLCDNRDGTWVPQSGTARMIVVSSTGRVRIAQNSSNGIPQTFSGTQISSCTPSFI